MFEVLADGTLGRDISADPALEFNTPGNVATVEKRADGPLIRPVSPGDTRVAARLGTALFAEPELLVQVGGTVVSGLARLEVSPDPMDLWSGEARPFSGVSVIPGAGQAPIDVSYSISPSPGQGIVMAEPDGQLRGLSSGTTQVVVEAVAPGTGYDGLSRNVTVHVTNPDTLRIEPSETSIRVGQTTPQFSVLAQDDDGRQYQVPVALNSMDTGILSPDGQLADRFVANSLGSTQVAAVYRSREVFATVTVTGERFLAVKPTLTEGEQDFHVSIEVLAALTEGPLEYRVYAVGQAPTEAWVPAEESGGQMRVVLRSPPMQYGPRTARYGLMVECRSQQDGSVQKYPFTFRLAPNIERTDSRP